LQVNIETFISQQVPRLEHILVNLPLTPFRNHSQPYEGKPIMFIVALSIRPAISAGEEGVVHCLDAWRIIPISKWLVTPNLRP